jgi:hypothetical protein
MAEPSHHAENRVRELGQVVVATLGRQKRLDRTSYRLEHILTFASMRSGAGETGRATC